MTGKTVQEIDRDVKRDKEWQSYIKDFNVYATKNGLTSYLQLSVDDQRKVWFNWWMA